MVFCSQGLAARSHPKTRHLWLVKCARLRRMRVRVCVCVCVSVGGLVGFPFVCGVGFKCFTLIWWWPAGGLEFSVALEHLGTALFVPNCVFYHSWQLAGKSSEKILSWTQCKVRIAGFSLWSIDHLCEGFLDRTSWLTFYSLTTTLSVMETNQCFAC